MKRQVIISLPNGEVLTREVSPDGEKALREQLVQRKFVSQGNHRMHDVSTELIRRGVKQNESLKGVHSNQEFDFSDEGKVRPQELPSIRKMFEERGLIKPKKKPC